MGEYVDAVMRLFGLTKEQIMNKRARVEGDTPGWWLHPMLALKVAGKCDPMIEAKVFSVFLRFITGEVTTEDSKIAASAMARSIGRISVASLTSRETTGLVAHYRRQFDTLNKEIEQQALQMREYKWKMESSAALAQKAYEEMSGSHNAARDELFEVEKELEEMRSGRAQAEEALKASQAEVEDLRAKMEKALQYSRGLQDCLEV